MGTIYYGSGSMPIYVEDRALAHLKVVIATKLRRDESFTVSWRHPEDQPRGRSTIWIHPSIPLRFVFDDPEPTELSREWIEELANSANSTGGIMLIAEYFDTEPIAVVAAEGSDGEPSDDGSSGGGSSDGKVTLGTVEVESLEIDRLKVAGDDVGRSDIS